MDNYFAQIEWPKPFLELYYFVGLFAALGAIGFRYTALRGRISTGDVFQVMARRAAIIGVIGALLLLAHIFEVLPRMAAREKTTVEGLLTGISLPSTWFYMTVLSIIGFGLAAMGRGIGWHLAAIGVLVGMLRNIFVLNWDGLIVPTHMVVGGLWIGTLAVLVGVGLSTLLKHPDRERRGIIVADMVNAFSPLALACGALVVIFGVLATLREFKPLSNIWSTPFGYTLIAKVAVVLVVFGFGAWNWKKQRPSLGSDEAAMKIRQSAAYELMAAMLVLILTAIMVSLPDPH
jgi:copper transport protein